MATSEHSVEARHSSNVLRDQRGAMFLMGIPICFFMIGLLYFVIGLGEELVLRERVQDAADSGALTAAVTFARAMNLIALINQLMAALVGLLIMVRMLEALVIVAEALCSALSLVTYGASLSLVPGLEVAREEAENAFQALHDVVEPIVEALHYLEVGIQYGMPAVGELRVIEITKSFKPVVEFGFAVPGDYPLPLTDGTWQELCKKGGEFAGSMIWYPIGKLIPIGAVKSAIEAPIKALAGTFPQVFCGEGSSSGLSIPEDLPDVPINQTIDKSVPPLGKQQACNDPPKDQADPNFQLNQYGLPQNMSAPQGPRGAQQEQRIENQQKVCEDAAMEQQLAEPGPDGAPNDHCTYNWGEQGTEVRTCNPAACMPAGSTTPCPEFTAKVEGAVDACAPDKKDVSKYEYQQQTQSWRADLIPEPNCGQDRDKCKYAIRFTSAQPAGQPPQLVKDAPNPPCGPNGTIGPEYNRSARWQADNTYADNEFLCVQQHTEVEPSMLEAKKYLTLNEWAKEFRLGEQGFESRWTLYTFPYVEPPRPEGWSPEDPWPPPTQKPPNVPDEQLAMVGSWIGVTYLHSCRQTIGNVKDSQEYKDAAKRANEESAQRSNERKALEGQMGGALGGLTGGGGGNCQGDQVHLKMKPADEDNILGGSTYQMRAIVIRSRKSSTARGIVRKIPMRLRHSPVSEGTDGLFFSTMHAALGSVFAAQAEYYFDSEYDEGKKDKQDRVKLGREEWMWHMDWKARMRRLRLADDDDSGGGSGGNQGGSQPSGSTQPSSTTGSGGGNCTDATAPSKDVNTAFDKSAGQSGSSSQPDDSSNDNGTKTPNSGGESMDLLQGIQEWIIH